MADQNKEMIASKEDFKQKGKTKDSPLPTSSQSEHQQIINQPQAHEIIDTTVQGLQKNMKHLHVASQSESSESDEEGVEQ